MKRDKRHSYFCNLYKCRT